MAFLIDRGIAAESEEEFDAEVDRYEELKNKLLGGQTMKYEEMEELLAAAKSRNDQKVIDVLKNIADDAVTESEKEPTKAEPTKAELLDKLIKMCKPGSGVRNALEEIKDKFALDESVASDPTGAPLDTLDAVIGKLKGDNDLTADDVWIEDSKEIALSYENVGWYENLNKWAEDPSDDIESDLTKIYDALLKSGYGLQYSRRAVEKAIIDAAVEAASDPEHITPKENRFGDWDNVATCNVYIPFEIVDGPTNVLPEDDETGRNSIASAAAGRLREGGFDVDVESPTAIRLNGGKTADEDEITSMLSDLGICAQEVSPGVFELDWTDPVAGIADEIEEKEELLPDSVVNEAVETLRRMY